MARIIAKVIFSAALIAATTLGCGQTMQPTQLPKSPTASLEQTVKQFYAPNSDIPFESRVERNSSEDIPADIKAGVLEKLNELYGKLKHNGKPVGQPDGVSEITLISVERHYVLPEHNVDDQIKTAKRGIEDIQRYLLGTGIEWPEVGFAVAGSEPELKKSLEARTATATTRRISIYPVQDYFEFDVFQTMLKYGNDILPVKIESKSYPAGESSRMFEFIPRNGRTNVTWSTGNVAWKINEVKETVFETPALEILHIAIAPITAKNIHANLEDAVGGKDFQGIVNKNVLLEEYVVHGIGQVWFDDINNRLGLGFSTVGLTSGWRTDENARRVASLVRQKGPGYVIQNYRDSRQELVAEAGIVMKQ